MSVSIPGAPWSPNTRLTSPTGCVLRPGWPVSPPMTTRPDRAPPPPPARTPTRCALRGPRPAKSPGWHQYSMCHARVVRHEICDAGLDVQPANDFAGASFEHLDDRSLRPASISGPFHTHGYAIAMHHLAHLLGGEKHWR